MNKLHEHIANSTLVKAAVIEAVHRFYYDRVLSDRQQDQQDLIDTQAADILATLWNLLPDWRYRLHSIPERYVNAGPIAALPIHGKPRNIVSLEITILIK